MGGPVLNLTVISPSIRRYDKMKQEEGKQFRQILNATLCVTLLWLSMAVGCKVGPDYFGPPASPEPINWTQSTLENVETSIPALDDWWTVFNDPTLNTILSNVNEQNLSLRQASWRIYEARASLCATRGDLFPTTGMDGSYTRYKTSGDGMPANTNLFGQTWTWGLSANWEIDVFGRIRRMVQSAEAALEATEDDYRNTKLILLADAARSYIDARLQQERMEIVKANIDQQREFLKIIEARYNAGKDDRLSYEQAVANLNSTESQYPLILSAYRESLNRLSVLTGNPPGTVDDIMRRVRAVPIPADSVAVSIPADLLRRRPDIRAAERRLAAQSENIGITKAEMYPKFFITGTFGLSASNFGAMFNKGNDTASIGPAFTWNLLQFGRIRCAVMMQEGITEQMRYAYQQSVLEAAEEVDNAISNFARLKQRVERLEETVLHYRNSLELSEKLYAAGKSNYLPVLDSQRYVLQYEETLSTARSNLANSMVQLYRALGGGWQVDPIAGATSEQINRFKNRTPAGYNTPSSDGELVNLRGSIQERTDVPQNISTPSKRAAITPSRPRTRLSYPSETPVPTAPKKSENVPEPSTPSILSENTDVGLDIFAPPVPAMSPRLPAPTVPSQDSEEVLRPGTELLDTEMNEVLPATASRPTYDRSGSVRSRSRMVTLVE